MCTVQWSAGTNLGFLVQARINPDPSNTMLDPNSTIVGRWDSGVNHKTLNCRDSMNSIEQPVPVSQPFMSFLILTLPVISTLPFEFSGNKLCHSL